MGKKAGLFARFDRRRAAAPSPERLPWRARWAIAALLLVATWAGWVSPLSAKETTIRYFPVGPIYEYRWKLLELALARAPNGGKSSQLVPFAEDITQNRGMQLLQSGTIDVIALGTNAEREAQMLPIKIDILRGIEERRGWAKELICSR